MLEKLKEQVCAANLQLVKDGLVVLTWGNVSGLSEDGQFVVIKPSGLSYDEMHPEHMVVTDRNGTVVEGTLRPSSDLRTHLALYRAFPGVKAIVHTHSRYATAMAQAERELPCYGTTHADHFYGTVPCTPQLTEAEIADDYEASTGAVIVRTFFERGIDPIATPAVLVARHGPFAWGESCEKAVQNALVLEETARMAILALTLNPELCAAPRYLQDKHYFRKHGPNAYYGQVSK